MTMKEASRRSCVKTAAMAGALATTTLPKRVFGKEESVDAGGDLAKPTKAQAAWQDLELGMFIHLGMFSVQPQIMPNDYDNYYPPEKFHPDKIDTDQWMEVAKSFGAEYAVLTAECFPQNMAVRT